MVVSTWSNQRVDSKLPEIQPRRGTIYTPFLHIWDADTAAQKNSGGLIFNYCALIFPF